MWFCWEWIIIILSFLSITVIKGTYMITRHLTTETFYQQCLKWIHKIWKQHLSIVLPWGSSAMFESWPVPIYTNVLYILPTSMKQCKQHMINEFIVELRKIIWIICVKMQDLRKALQYGDSRSISIRSIIKPEILQISLFVMHAVQQFLSWIWGYENA